MVLVLVKDQNFYTLNQVILLTGMLAVVVALVRMAMVVMAVVMDWR